MVGRIIVCSLLFSLHAAAQQPEPADSLSSAEKAPGLIDRIHQLQQWLDNKAKKKVDPLYIEVPDKPWRVILRDKVTAVRVDLDNTIEFPELNESSDWSLRFEPPMSTSIGFWVGYRGTGISYAKSLAKNAGRYYAFSTTGAKYGFNFRLRRFNATATTLTATDYENGQKTGESRIEGDMPAPVWIRSVYANGYYVFNGRRYSQAAAYNQSVIQRRSAGSLLLGATWYQSSFDYADTENAVFMLLSNNIAKIKVHQANLGIGYGYNLVPFRGFVVNAMAMPTISIYNRVKAYKFDFNYCLPYSYEVEDNFGKWDPTARQWENGEKVKPMMYSEEDGRYDFSQFDYWEVEPETTYSALRVNFDLRLGIAYNWKRYFIGLQTQFNNFSYKKGKNSVNIYDAYTRLALGVRL